jgi:hypothetical protein
MDEKIKRRGRGRPVKKVPRGQKRIQVSMILSAEIKTRIDDVAKRNGRTFSQTGEMLVERALAVDDVLRQMNRPLEGIARENFEAEMTRRGYTKLRGLQFPGGFAWIPPEAPGERSGFKPWDEGEYVPPSVEIPAPDPLPDNRDTPTPTTKDVMTRLAALEALVRQTEKKD